MWFRNKTILSTFYCKQALHKGNKLWDFRGEINITIM